MIDASLWMAFAILTPDGRAQAAPVVSAAISWQATSVPASLQGRVEGEVTAIWSRLGIDVQWRDAQPGEVHVAVIVEDTRTDTNAFPALGWVTFVDRKPSAVLYASADATRRTVWAGRTESGRFADDPRQLQDVLVGRLLGRAIAHELGHYLLGSQAHTPRGLMRASLDAADALTRTAGYYGLDAAQLRTLQQRMDVLTLAARAGAPAGSCPADSPARAERCNT